MESNKATTTNTNNNPPQTASSSSPSPSPSQLPLFGLAAIAASLPPEPPAQREARLKAALLKKAMIEETLRALTAALDPSSGGRLLTPKELRLALRLGNHFFTRDQAERFKKDVLGDYAGKPGTERHYVYDHVIYSRVLDRWALREYMGVEGYYQVGFARMVAKKGAEAAAEGLKAGGQVFVTPDGWDLTSLVLPWLW
jgi:hypothetical protein